MSDPSGLGSRVQNHLDDFLTGRRAMLSAVGPETGPLLDAAAAAVAGGKRLRPAFCVAGWQAAGGSPDDDRALRAAAALELLQAGALVHDDLMDGSDTRRGRPSVHRVFERRHRDAGWYGEAERFGAGAALLLGDLLLTWAHEMMRGCGLDPATVDRGAPWFDACTTEVAAGQYLDLVAQATATTHEDVALRVIRYKSASYTVVRPLHLGAALGGGDDTLLTGLTAYGSPVGVAFQLRDDVLGVFGDPDQTGKPAGEDLREGKRTVLLARTFARAAPDERELLDRLVGDPGLDAAGLRRLRELIVGCGALASTEQNIAELEAAARSVLGSLPVAHQTRDRLAALATAALQRSR